MKKIEIKFYRPIPRTLESYGPLVIRRLDDLAGGADKWDMSKFHGIAKVPGTKIMIERHEDGPEVLNMVLTQLPNYIDALANLAAAWCAYKGLWRAKEQRTVRLRSGKHTFEGPIKNSRDLRLIAATLKSLK